jgi:hypothetical protein
MRAKFSKKLLRPSAMQRLTLVKVPVCQGVAIPPLIVSVE